MLRSQMCQAVETMQHEVTCRLPKSRSASVISPCDGSVLCAASILRGGLCELERRLRPVVPLWTCSSMDKCISMLRALRAQVKKCGANDLSPVPVAAPKVEHESVLRGGVNCISLAVCQHCSCTPAQTLRTPSNAHTSALAQVFNQRVIHAVESQHSFNLVAEQWSTLSKPMWSLPCYGSLATEQIS